LIDKINNLESDVKETKIIQPPEENCVTFSNASVFEKLFENFNRVIEPKEKKLCAITGLHAKYFDPLTKTHYANKDAFKIIRERYFQKEEDSLLFRIQTISDFASQKKEKLKKIFLSEGDSNFANNSNKNILQMVNKYGILKNDISEFDKKHISRKKFNNF
jgi:hypothetical protein